MERDHHVYFDLGFKDQNQVSDLGGKHFTHLTSPRYSNNSIFHIDISSRATIFKSSTVVEECVLLETRKTRDTAWW